MHDLHYCTSLLLHNLKQLFWKVALREFTSPTIIYCIYKNGICGKKKEGHLLKDKQAEDTITVIKNVKKYKNYIPVLRNCLLRNNRPITNKYL